MPTIGSSAVTTGLIKSTKTNDTSHRDPPKNFSAMGHSAGLRAGTRYAFSRSHKKKGSIRLGTYLKGYKVGDVVDVVANGAVQKGMPFKDFHGKTGVVYNVTRSAVGVILYKQVGNRYIEKRVNVRTEHVVHSRSREEFLVRVKDNAAKKKKAKEAGEQFTLKRLPAQPREERTVSAKGAKPENVYALAYETTI